TVDLRCAIGISHQERVRDFKYRVVWFWVPFPLKKPDAATVRAILAVDRRLRLEGLMHEVGDDDDATAHATMPECGRQCSLDGPFINCIHDRVVDEHEVELSVEVERSHVSEHMLAFGVELSANREHLG